MGNLLLPVVWVAGMLGVVATQLCAEGHAMVMDWEYWVVEEVRCLPKSSLPTRVGKCVCSRRSEVVLTHWGPNFGLLSIFRQCRLEDTSL